MVNARDINWWRSRGKLSFNYICSDVYLEWNYLIEGSKMIWEAQGDVPYSIISQGDNQVDAYVAKCLDNLWINFCLERRVKPQQS